jgi:hypothetical protein
MKESSVRVREAKKSMLSGLAAIIAPRVQLREWV